MEQLFIALLHHFIYKLPEAIFDGMDDNVPTIEFERPVKLSMKLVSRLNLVGANPLCFSSGKIKSFMNIDSVEEENQSVHNVSPVNESHFDGNFCFTTIRDDQTTETPWTDTLHLLISCCPQDMTRNGI
ncbi:hypothetical protein Syun_031524 [Stephania yunnanensis]|uniref:Uncharacterized protein n=1 Tax=Stephania yunnanensis TaxID=152371 RepID=A0AAP0HCS8_9MAGN